MGGCCAVRVMRMGDAAHGDVAQGGLIRMGVDAHGGMVRKGGHCAW